MREDLAVALIKSLPKQLRREVVPAPDFAAAALALLPDGAWLVTERPGRLRMVGADGTLFDGNRDTLSRDVGEAGAALTAPVRDA